MTLLLGLAMTVVEVFLPCFVDRGMNRAFSQAKPVVENLYAEIGIRIVWRPTNSLPPGCTSGRIVMDFQSRVEGRGPRALAVAYPYAKEGPCVRLLIDRLRESLDRNPDSTSILLGHVLAHELGHALQRIDRHSEFGLMKAVWSAEDITAMREGKLRFMPIDADLILTPLRASTE